MNAVTTAPDPSVPPRRRGMILIVTILIVFAIAALALSLGYSMRAEAGIAANAAAGREAQLAERAAEQYVLAALVATTDDDTGTTLNSLDESYWSNVAVGGGAAGGRFWVVRPDYADPYLPLFGLVSEAAKIDLNTVDFPRLMKLPGMTEPLAASIIDWRDADDDPNEGVGSESQAYQGKTPAYRCKNAPFETVDELLLVDGMTPELLYGPANQPPLGVAAGASNGGGGLFASEHWQRRGFFDLFTVWSDVPKLAPDGSERLDVNAEDLGPVREKLNQILGDGKGNSIRRRQNNVFSMAKNLGLEQEDLRKLEPLLHQHVQRPARQRPARAGQDQRQRRPARGAADGRRGRRRRFGRQHYSRAAGPEGAVPRHDGLDAQRGAGRDRAVR